MTSFEGVGWRKSSYSGGDNACVEIANAAELVAVRDSKAPRAGLIVMTSAAWAALVHVVNCR